MNFHSFVQISCGLNLFLYYYGLRMIAMNEFLMSSEAVVGGGKPKKKNPAADGGNRRALIEIGNLPTIRGTDPNTSSRVRFLSLLLVPILVWFVLSY